MYLLKENNCWIYQREINYWFFLSNMRKLLLYFSCQRKIKLLPLINHFIVIKDVFPIDFPRWRGRDFINNIFQKTVISKTCIMHYKCDIAFSFNSRYLLFSNYAILNQCQYICYRSIIVNFTEIKITCSKRFTPAIKPFALQMCNGVSPLLSRTFTLALLWTSLSIIWY